MRHILTVCVVLALFTIGCEKSEAVRAQEWNQRMQVIVNDVVSRIQYIKDTRTGQCFAYYWGGLGDGGPALATVPCEAIPSQLLTIAIH